MPTHFFDPREAAFNLETLADALASDDLKLSCDDVLAIWRDVTNSAVNVGSWALGRGVPSACIPEQPAEASMENAVSYLRRLASALRRLDAHSAVYVCLERRDVACLELSPWVSR